MLHPANLFEGEYYILGLRARNGRPAITPGKNKRQIKTGINSVMKVNTGAAKEYSMDSANGKQTVTCHAENAFNNIVDQIPNAASITPDGVSREAGARDELAGAGVACRNR